MTTIRTIEPLRREARKDIDKANSCQLLAISPIAYIATSQPGRHQGTKTSHITNGTRISRVNTDLGLRPETGQDPWVDEAKATEVSKNRNFLSPSVLGALSAFRLALGQDPKMCNLGIHEWHRGAVGSPGPSLKARQSHSR